jgi:hypothetical protein
MGTTSGSPEVNIPNRRLLCPHSLKNHPAIATFRWEKNPGRKRSVLPVPLYIKQELKPKNSTPQRRKGQPA